VDNLALQDPRGKAKAKLLEVQSNPVHNADLPETRLKTVTIHADAER
jgi:hypothetical protein